MVWKYNNGTLVLDTDNTSIGNRNPFRYKSYYLDIESRLYYLNSRYYNPRIGRFITIDSIDYIDESSIYGYNLYCYCGNNPVMYVDTSGHMPEWAMWLIGGVAFAGAIALTALTGGALAPVFIGMGASIATSAIIGGTVSYFKEGDFWSGFSHGAAEGAMWGGIFALGGAVLRTVKMFKNGVAIGENMKRVEKLAKCGGQITYKGMPGYKIISKIGGDNLARQLSIEHNKRFIERMMNWGVKLVDYGIDASRDYRSFYYLMEAIVSNGYEFLQIML